MISDAATSRVIDLILGMLNAAEKKSARAQLRHDEDKSRSFQYLWWYVHGNRLQISRVWGYQRNLSFTSLLGALHVFCTVRPIFVIKHFDKLHTYLSPLPRNTNIYLEYSSLLKSLASIMRMISLVLDSPTKASTKHL